MPDTGEHHRLANGLVRDTIANGPSPSSAPRTGVQVPPHPRRSGEFPTSAPGSPAPRASRSSPQPSPSPRANALTRSRRTRRWTLFRRGHQPPPRVVPRGQRIHGEGGAGEGGVADPRLLHPRGGGSAPGRWETARACSPPLFASRSSRSPLPPDRGGPARPQGADQQLPAHRHPWGGGQWSASPSRSGVARLSSPGPAGAGPARREGPAHRPRRCPKDLATRAWGGSAGARAPRRRPRTHLAGRRGRRSAHLPGGQQTSTTNDKREPAARRASSSGRLQQVRAERADSYSNVRISSGVFRRTRVSTTRW